MLVTMKTDKINLPAIYTHTPPHKEKINSHMLYYIEHGTFKRDIVVTQKGLLVDGYCDYIVAVVCGMDSVQCELNTKRLKQGIEKKRNISNRPRKRKILYDRQRGKCAKCGKRLQIDDYKSADNYLTFDHILAVSRGGSNGLSNLQGLCAFCNNRKKDNLEVGQLTYRKGWK